MDTPRPVPTLRAPPHSLPQKRKEIDVELLGRAHFDPNYAHEDELTHDDLGLEDLADPTDTVIENRLRQARRRRRPCDRGLGCGQAAERLAGSRAKHDPRCSAMIHRRSP